jgi:hypothetical protein
MVGLWQHHDLESLEAISQSNEARRIFLKMATMSQEGRLPQFLDQLAIDPEIDDDVKGTLTELALDRTFLFAVEDYLRRTQHFH